MNFVPLHVYSGYSFLRSGLSIAKIVSRSKKNGYFGVGLSDYQSLTGYPELFHLTQKSEMPLCFGMDFLVDGQLLSAYIQDETGYLNLIKICLLSNKGSLSKADLLPYSEGLTFVLSVESSMIASLYPKGEEEVAKWLVSFQAGLSSFYLGLPYGIEDEKLVPFVREFVNKYPYDTVAFPHFLYDKKEDAIVLLITKAIANDENLEEKTKEGPHHFLDEAQLHEYYSDAELFSSRQILERCRFDFLKKRGGILVYPQDSGLSSQDYLRKLANDGLRQRKPDFDKTYQERLDYELGIICQMGYADYFLIVKDYLDYARSSGIFVGPGRGSGAASLVCYALYIVKTDPLKYDLLFERFLSPERQSMPDIDADFMDIRRDEVVDYIISKYGKDRVSRIVTLQSIGAKQSLRDIGRVYKFENREIDMISKLVTGLNWTLGDAYRKNPAFKSLIDSDKYYLQIVSLASKIEGLPRQSGIHPAGVILNNRPLEDSIPVLDVEGLGYVAQYEAPYLEEQGFLKMDILGLRNLTIIKECLDLILENQGVKIDYDNIPFEDNKAISLIAQGKTMGLFQLESPGINRAIAQIKPTEFSDIIALLALYRPGPMQNIETFAQRKNGLEKVTYLAPELEKILSSTYGVIVYQEQVMQIVRVLAGFTFGQADLFRRAISKKDAHKLQLLQKDFIQGCLNNGKSRQLAEKAYALIYKFADYGFNKAHALDYAVLTCEMAYLKASYPNEFYAAVLDNTGGAGDNRFSSIISEIKKQHIKLALPDINSASLSYSLKDGKLVFPLTALKGLQSGFLKDVYDERIHNGPFKSIFEFALRMKRFGLSLPMLVRMVDGGCFDSINPSRASLRACCPSALNYAEMMVGEDGKQIQLFGIPEPEVPVREDDLLENLNAEYEALGIMISGSPLSLYEDSISKLHATPLADLSSASSPIVTVGLIKSIRTITTKKGSTMAFLSLYDDNSEGDFTMFSEVYTNSYPLLEKDKAVIVKCHKDYRREDSYLADEIKELK